MRRTGKYWWLTVSSAGMALLSSVLFASWNSASWDIHLWLDIVPGGLGGSSVITSTLIALISSVDREHIAVATGLSYVARTTGQVLGVSLSAAVMQAVLTRRLRELITGPGAEDTIRRIRHSTEAIRSLDPQTRDAAIASYGLALKTVFICQAVIAFLTMLACLPIQEFALAGTHEEQAEHERQRREQLQQSQQGENENA